MTPLPPGIDTDAFLSGFGLGIALIVIVWGAVIGIAIVRRMLEVE